jgi:hypothetical protein
MVSSVCERDTVDPLLTDPYGSEPGSDNLKGRLKRAPIEICEYGENTFSNIEFPAWIIMKETCTEVFLI